MYRNLGDITKNKVKSMTVKGKKEEFEDESSIPDSNPQLDNKIRTREFKSFAKSFRCAARSLKFRYQTRCSNLLMYIDNIFFF